MKNVISLIEKIKEKKALKEENISFYNHSHVLEICDELFPYGVILIELTKESAINISTTIEDEELFAEALVASALKINGEDYEEDELNNES